MAFRRVKRIRRAELVSLIDVAFLLLVFFLVVASGQVIGSRAGLAPARIVPFRLPVAEVKDGTVEMRPLTQPFVEAASPASYLGVEQAKREKGWLILLVRPELLEGRSIDEYRNEIIRGIKQRGSSVQEAIKGQRWVAWLPDDVGRLPHGEFQRLAGVKKIREFIHDYRADLGTGIVHEKELGVRADAQVPFRIVELLMNECGDPAPGEPPIEKISFRLQPKIQ